MPHYKVKVGDKEAVVLATNPDAAKSSAFHVLSKAFLAEVEVEEVEVGRDTTAFSSDDLPPQEAVAPSGPKSIGRVAGEVISDEEAEAEGEESKKSAEDRAAEEKAKQAKVDAKAEKAAQSK